MIGRRSTIERIQHHLERDKPEHVSVIGSARYGKSVILSELERRYAPGCPGYHTAVYLDLRRHTPETDNELRQQIADELQKVFADSWAEIAELLKFEDVELRERMQLVGRELAQTDDRVLMIMDGFDEVLANPGITRAIWDGLLRIADLPVLRLVTGSRLPLRELCRTEESRTSDFWEIFHDVPVVVGGFDEEDWTALIKTFTEAGVEIDTSARGALTQWTGNVPVLTVALMQSLWEEARDRYGGQFHRHRPLGRAAARSAPPDSQCSVGGLFSRDENRSRRPGAPRAPGARSARSPTFRARAPGLRRTSGQAIGFELPPDGEIRWWAGSRRQQPPATVWRRGSVRRQHPDASRDAVEPGADGR